MADLSVTLFGKPLRNPVMNASGTLGYGVEIEPLWKVDTLGAYVSKGLSFTPHHGNPPPRLWEETSGIINSVGLQNIGLKRFLAEVLPLFEERNTPMVINFFGFTEDDYVRFAEAIPAHRLILALEMNLSCPNIKQGGICLGKESGSVFAIVRRVKGATPLPIVAKLTPEVTDIVGIARAAYEAGAEGITVLNTFPSQGIDVKHMSPALRGGLSGPFLKPMAIRAIYDISRNIPLPVIGAGGIMTAQDALAFLMAGAAALQVGTATFIDPFAIPKIITGIEAYLDDRHIPTLNEIIGAAGAQSRTI
jgi:dihydroorotate dehydrogenase (NAD+) catalytic subunit